MVCYTIEPACGSRLCYQRFPMLFCNWNICNKFSVFVIVSYVSSAHEMCFKFLALKYFLDLICLKCRGNRRWCLTISRPTGYRTVAPKCSSLETFWARNFSLSTYKKRIDRSLAPVSKIVGSLLTRGTSCHRSVHT